MCCVVKTTYALADLQAKVSFHCDPCAGFVVVPCMHNDVMSKLPVLTKKINGIMTQTAY